MTAIIHYSDAPVVSSVADGRLLLSHDSLQIIRLCLQPGEAIEPHVNPFAVVVFVLSGEGKMEVTGQETTVSEGTLIDFEPGVARGFVNSGSGPFVLLVIKKL